MADADRDSDIGDDSLVIANLVNVPSPDNMGAELPHRWGDLQHRRSRSFKESARSEGESSGDQSCESSDEGVSKETTLGPHVPMAPMTPLHQTALQHQPALQRQRQPLTAHNGNHPSMNNHQIQHQRNLQRPLERELQVRDDFESLKSSLHPHLSSLASLAQGAPLSTSNNVFALAGGGGSTRGFPYAPPAFLAPAPPPPAQPAGSTTSSSSSEGSAGWSFEEQYKQVRQLYELSDDPQRKEFLDDLFSFMQRKNTPINRLPIMAKSVLDLYQLYNLVVARGGLVEVINKKLWQEIIKGLHLPASITSAAFTLRTQYMKYLYEYECDKKNFSTKNGLEVAIESNKREGRRSSGQYEPQATLVTPFSRAVSLPQYQHGMQTLPMMSLPCLPHPSQLQPGLRMVQDCMKIFNQQALTRTVYSGNPESPPALNGVAPMLTPREAFDMAAAGFAVQAALFNNNNMQLSREPQRYVDQPEALNLSESSGSSGTRTVKRESSSSPPASSKRRRSSPTSSPRLPSPRQSSSRQSSPRQSSPRQSSSHQTPPRQSSPRQSSPRQSPPRPRSPRLPSEHLLSPRQYSQQVPALRPRSTPTFSSRPLSNGDVNGLVNGEVNGDINEEVDEEVNHVTEVTLRFVSRGRADLNNDYMTVHAVKNGVPYNGIMYPESIGYGSSSRRTV